MKWLYKKKKPRFLGTFFFGFWTHAFIATFSPSYLMGCAPYFSMAPKSWYISSTG